MRPSRVTSGRPRAFTTNVLETGLGLPPICEQRTTSGRVRPFSMTRSRYSTCQRRSAHGGDTFWRLVGTGIGGNRHVIRRDLA
jgi:hypothetical protein